ncbi:hypothetical protein HY380_01080 [Candidatus Saccharibacteria bacterium]|nr:hypothetical protein [Candidatus Saccharibacteria bacterium]
MLKIATNSLQTAKRFKNLIWLVLILSFTPIAIVSTVKEYRHNNQLQQLATALVEPASVDEQRISLNGDKVAYNSGQDDSLMSKVTIDGQADSRGQFPYQAELSTQPADGTTFADAKGDLPFKAVPLDNLNSGSYQAGQMVYGQTATTSHILTLKKNGLKEDIVMTKATANDYQFSWRLELGDKLSAKLQPDGSVGIFSASPYLYGDIQISDDKSRSLIEKARAAGDKNYLIYSLPQPYIIESQSDGSAKATYEDVSYSLDGDILTLTATNLLTKSYPLSIDPSTVVVTSNSDFTAGKDDGSIDYTTPGQISRATLGVGNNAAFTTNSTYFSFPRYGHTTVAYKGYLYIMGGYELSSDNNCKNTGETTNYCNDVQYAPINSDGSVGTFTTSANYFSIPRYGHTSFAYNGYIYIVGGLVASATTSCKNSGSSTRCNDIQYATVNADGSIGTWSSNSTYFSIPRYGHSTFVNNGYVYVLGGQSATSDTNCKDTGTNQYCNDIQYAPLRANGTLGSWTTNSTYFSYPRYFQAAVVYNNYLYILGGYQANSDTNCKDSGTSNYCNDIQFAAIANDGSIGSFTTSNNYFFYPRYNHSAFAYNGYLYVVGGFQVSSATTCKGSGTSQYCSDVTYAPILANYNIGVFSSSYNYPYLGRYFSIPRQNHAVTLYNGYIYVTGGLEVSSDTNCKDTGTNQYCNDVQYSRFNTGAPNTNPSSTWPLSAAFSSSSNYFTTPRYAHTTVAYNGYLYTMGGYELANDTACKDTGTSQYCNDVYYAQINANGTIGGWTLDSSSYFATPRAYYAAVAYNGYMYIMGGQIASSSTSCKDSGTSVYCNDIQYAAINSNGTLGTFSTNSNYFSYPRSGLSAVIASNGYLYIMGGYQNSSATTCKSSNSTASNYCNDVQYAVVNGNGSIGAFTTSSNYFTTPRYQHASVTYNGYIYILGGYIASSATSCKDSGTSNYCNDIQYAQVNSDGSIGAWVTSPQYFRYPRYAHSASVYNGVLYIVAGYQETSNTNCKTSTTNNYCTDVQYAPITQNGNIYPVLTSNNYISIPRAWNRTAVYNNYLYTTGGFEYTSDTNCKNSGTNQYCNDTQISALTQVNQKATYEKMIDLGSVVSNVSSIVYNGTIPCGNGVTISYTTAGSDGIFGSATQLTGALPGVAQSVNIASKRYVFVRIIMNDEACGGTSKITDITINYVQVPAAPTLTSPSSGATGVALAPVFTFRTTDADNDYLKYRLYLYASDCSTPVGSSPFTQASSQTGWSGQDQQDATAYTGNATIGSSTLATYTYQATLSYNTTYCWKADAIDPAGTNGYSAASSTRTFTTVANSTPAAPTLNQPIDGDSGLAKAPQFRMSSSDADGDYLQYKIEVCSTSNCSSVVRTITQASSQTGWTSQSLQSGTAYASGALGVHDYQTPELTANTQYWWRAYAIDPGGTNTYSSASTISTFTTGAGIGDNPYNGGVIIGQ